MSSLMGCSFLGRETHQDFVDISSVGPGVYFIGCEDRVVYIGQSINSIAHRSIASLTIARIVSIS